MLSKITWMQFLSYAGSALLVYYAVVVGLLHPKLFFSLLKKPRRAGPQQAAPGPMMGAAVTEAPRSLLEPEEALFEETLPDEAGRVLPLARLSPLVLQTQAAELLQECYLQMEVVREGEGSKEDFLALYRGLSLRFPALTDPAQRAFVQAFLVRQAESALPFPLNAAELENAWLESQLEYSPENTPIL